MTKHQEISILRDTIARLGPDSYCGPWLIGQLGAIESAMASDYSPACYALSPSEALKESMRLIQEAKADAAKIRTAADKEAEGIRQLVLNWRNEIRAGVRIQLEGFIAKL
jgi:hypothetical protein